MSIKVYRVKIEGYVTYEDFGSPMESKITPADWGLENIVEEMGGNYNITETLVDTISSTERV
jgi:hypothetical protein